MELIKHFIDIIIHLDKYLVDLVTQYGVWTYAILFLIIFCETGLVVTPFLPGDSLLFVAGSLAAGPTAPLELWILIVSLIVAAILGDNVNYWVGRFFGQRVLGWKLFGRQLVRQKDMDKTHEYFEKYGARTIIIARFVPIVRTLAPFAAGIGNMDYRRSFTPFNIAGAVLWIVLLTVAGYFFGRHPFVQKHYETVILGIIGISVLPMVIEFLRIRFGRGNSPAA
ncbi:MAG: DedA family protein [Flavobacteriales bacterium]|nr:DedA family protein [Flavobacteriales bacterium]